MKLVFFYGVRWTQDTFPNVNKYFRISGVSRIKNKEVRIIVLRLPLQNNFWSWKYSMVFHYRRVLRTFSISTDFPHSVIEKGEESRGTAAEVWTWDLSTEERGIVSVWWKLTVRTVRRIPFALFPLWNLNRPMKLTLPTVVTSSNTKTGYFTKIFNPITRITNSILMYHTHPISNSNIFLKLMKPNMIYI